MGVAETTEAIEAAAAAFPSWSRTTAKVPLCKLISFYILRVESGQPQHRHDILVKFFQLMQQHHEDLGRLIVSPLYQIA